MVAWRFACRAKCCKTSLPQNPGPALTAGQWEAVLEGLRFRNTDTSYVFSRVGLQFNPIWSQGIRREITLILGSVDFFYYSRLKVSDAHTHTHTHIHTHTHACVTRLSRPDKDRQAHERALSSSLPHVQHFYRYYASAQISWSAALTACAAKEFNGLQVRVSSFFFASSHPALCEMQHLTEAPLT